MTARNFPLVPRGIWSTSSRTTSTGPIRSRIRTTRETAAWGENYGDPAQGVSVLEDGRWRVRVRGVRQCDQDGDASGGGCGGAADGIIPGYRPPKCPDLMRRGEHSHPLKPQSEMVWLLSEWQTERMRIGQAANQLPQSCGRASILGATPGGDSSVSASERSAPGEIANDEATLPRGGNRDFARQFDLDMQVLGAM